MTQIKEPLKSPATVYHNGSVAVGKDLVFGWVVLTVPDDSEQSQWTPIAQLTLDEQRSIRRKMDNNPLFPEELRLWLADLTAPAAPSEQTNRMLDAVLSGKPSAEVRKLMH